ncbi:MAG: hypothetical protein KKC46_20120, partial [Proteobacteria bacterium]|nr:hypothetical protein [Pseudomonadota bacterium]
MNKEEKNKRELFSGCCKGEGFLLLCLLVCFSFVSICNASESDNFQFGPRDKAYGIHFIDNNKGWIVGDMGLAAMTSDGGENWKQVVILKEGAFKDIFFVGDAGWIVGDGGLILHSDNGGKSWDRQTSDIDTALLKVFFINKKEGFAVGAEGSILKTNNGGTSWEVISLDLLNFLPQALIERGIITINLYDVIFLDEFSGWIVGDSGTILHTSDGGKTWLISKIGLLPSLYSVSFKSKKEGWAVGQNGFILKTGDGGRSWEKDSLDTKENLYRIVIHGDYGVIVGDHGVVIKSNDGETTWFHDNPP